MPENLKPPLYVQEAHKQWQQQQHEQQRWGPQLASVHYVCLRSCHVYMEDQLQ